MMDAGMFPLAGGVCELHDAPLRWMQQIKVQKHGNEKRRTVVKTRFCPKCRELTEGRETETNQVTLEVVAR